MLDFLRLPGRQVEPTFPKVKNGRYGGILRTVLDCFAPTSVRLTQDCPTGQ